MKQLFDQPAIIKQVDVRSELAPKIRQLARRTEEDQLQIGKWLGKCKEACLAAGEEWLTWLEKETGIPQQTAWRWMNLAKDNGQEKSSITQMSNGVPTESQIEEPLQKAESPSSAPEREPGSDDDEFDAKDEAKEQKRREAARPAPAKKDAIGQSIPACQKDIFGDPLLPESIDWLQEAQAEVSRMHERLKRKLLFYPFAHLKAVYEHLDEAEVALQLARESLEPGVPHVVCPRCHGKKCSDCRSAGHLPRWRYEELEEQEGSA